MKTTPPVAPPPIDAIERPPHELVRPRPVRNGLLVFAAAVVWPILLGGVGWFSGLLSPSAPEDLVFLIGGLSVIFLVPIAMAMPQQGELLIMILLPFIWLAVVGLLPYLLRHKLGRRSRFLPLLLGISFFSLLQAMLGLLMIGTRGV